MNSKDPPSFGRAGRPRKVAFSDIFLLDPKVEIELLNGSLSSLARENNLSQRAVALLQDMGRMKKISSKRMNLVRPELETMLKEKAGLSETSLENRGPWECLLYGLSAAAGKTMPPTLSKLAKHIIGIEQALIAPTQSFLNNQFSKCANQLKSSSILSDYLWPKLISNIRKAKSQSDLLHNRVLVMIEMQWSWMAYWDVFSVPNPKNRGSASVFDSLFPNFQTNPIQQPNSLFFNMLSAYLGDGSRLYDHVPQLSIKTENVDIDSIKRQLRRWNSGKGFPSDEVLDGLFRNILGERAHQKHNSKHSDWILCWAKANHARRMNFLMPLFNIINGHPEIELPFGHSSLQSWRRARFRHWMKYWRMQIST